MTPEYLWAIAGVLCLIVLFTMIAVGSAASRNDSLDHAELDDDTTKGAGQ